MSDVWTPPTAPLEGADAEDRTYAKDMRRRYFNHETAVKSIGTLYYFIAGMFILAMGVMVFPFEHSMAEFIISAIIPLALAALFVWLGRGLKQLRPWAKIPAGILSGIGLIGFPVWTLINGYILYLLFSEKGKVVFSDDYKQVIADTPGIESRTSLIVWIFIALLVSMAVFAIYIMRNTHY